MATYWAILEKMKGSSLRLTKMDDEIYEHFRTEFPDFNPQATIDENEMKSKTGKEKWRNFMMAYEKKIDDYNFGTMLRANPKFEYGEKETIFGLLSNTHSHAPELTPELAMRMQFYAIEIARYASSRHVNDYMKLITVRNRDGLNDWIYDKEHPEHNKNKT